MFFIDYPLRLNMNGHIGMPARLLLLSLDPMRNFNLTAFYTYATADDLRVPTY